MPQLKIVNNNIFSSKAVFDLVRDGNSRGTSESNLLINKKHHYAVI